VSAIPRTAPLARWRLEGDALAAGLALLAATSAALAVFMAVAPHAFFSSIGPFGAANSHYIRDAATFYGAFAVGQAIAVRRASWRVPVLALTGAQYALHTINHLVDIDAAHPAWTGYFDFFSLLAGTGLIGWLLRAALRRQPPPPPSLTRKEAGP
jgi:hypothetical protein